MYRNRSNTRNTPCRFGGFTLHFSIWWLNFGCPNPNVCSGYLWGNRLFCLLNRGGSVRCAIVRLHKLECGDLLSVKCFRFWDSTGNVFCYSSPRSQNWHPCFSHLLIIRGRTYDFPPRRAVVPVCRPPCLHSSFQRVDDWFFCDLNLAHVTRCFRAGLSCIFHLRVAVQIARCLRPTTLHYQSCQTFSASSTFHFVLGEIQRRQIEIVGSLSRRCQECLLQSLAGKQLFGSTRPRWFGVHEATCVLLQTNQPSRSPEVSVHECWPFDGGNH